jgi:tetrapyrrole methylase family protein/MazG family protein
MVNEKNKQKFEKLKAIIAELRGPDGCPWDREQTHKTLKPYLIEECYEVLKAIEEEEDKKLCGEMGDLLLQIMLHAQIADEEGEFTIEDVIESLNEKLIKRHPHVFGDIKVQNSAEVTQNWEVIKQEERGKEESLLGSVPEKMPALSYSQSIQRRVAAVGFDWKEPEDILEKLTEEVKELLEADSHEEKIRELGDLMFTLVNIGRRLDVNMEMALREANKRFYKRYSYMEEECREKGIELKNLKFEEQNELWEEAKRRANK